MHAVIVSNGFPPTKELLEAEVESADFIIGADGGGNKILSHGITPDAVIGDMDSFKKPDTINFEIIHDKSQETNDLEKALSLAFERKATTCTVLGAFGKRMDHALKNLSVLKRFKSDFDTLIYKDELFEAFVITDQYKAEVPIGSVVSLFPLSGEVTGITTSGLKYSLDNEILKNGQRDGTSNETTEQEFSIRIESGDLVVFVEKGS
jgi:thiamine pyrophosphokinase